jgi:hypothetical protein
LAEIQNKTKDLLIIAAGVGALLLSVIMLSKEMIHYVYEALAIPFGIYFIWYGWTQAKGVNKYIFVIFGAGNIIIDGYLLIRNMLYGGGI